MGGSDATDPSHMMRFQIKCWVCHSCSTVLIA